MVGALAVGLLAGVTSAQELLVNGDFETGGPHGLGWIEGDYEYWPEGWLGWGQSGWHHNDAGRVIDTKAVKFWWDDCGLWQDFVATAGEEYDFSVSILNSTAEPATWNGLIKAEFYDAAWAQLDAVELERFYSAAEPMDTWVEIGGSLTAPAGTAYGRIVLLEVDWFEGVGGPLNFDNASVTPEPATLALLGLGGLALLCRRRA